MPRNTVVKSFHIPHRSWARATGEEEKTKPGKCLGRFPRTGVCSRGTTVSAIWYVVWTFSSPVLFADFKSCRTLALLFRWLRDTNNHHHPYIDSTTVLSDNCIYYSHIFRVHILCLITHWKMKLSQSQLRNGLHGCDLLSKELCLHSHSSLTLYYVFPVDIYLVRPLRK